MMEKNWITKNRPVIIWIYKAFILLLVTTVTLKYWLIPDRSIFYWPIAGILMYGWNCARIEMQKNRIAVFVWSVLLSAAVLVTYMVKNKFVLNSNGIILAEFACLVFSSWIIVNLFCILFDWISAKTVFNCMELRNTGIGNKKEFLCVSAFIFIMWFPYFLTYYPGLIFGDSLNSIYQALGIYDWNNHFPVIYSIFVKVCIQFGLIFEDLNIGYAIYTLIQMAVISSVLAYVVCWIKYKGFSTLAIFCCLYYAFEPLFPQHAIAMWKDGIFSAFLSFLSIQIFDFVISKGVMAKSRKFCVKSIVSAIIISFFRNNGVYVIGLIGICLGLYTCINRENYKEKVKYISCFCTVIAIVFIVTGPIYEMHGIDDDEVEKYGILLQQMARTVFENGHIDSEEYDVLNEMLPMEKYKELYNAQLVDPIKWDRDFNENFLEENQGRFIKTWFKLLIDNPKIYVKAYLEMTYQYWVPNAWENNECDKNIIWGNIEGAVTNPWWENAQVKYCNLLENRWIDTKRLFSITTPMAGVGLLVWFMFLVILYALTKGKGALILSLIPCVGVLITLLIATPSGYWPRYMLVIYFMLPIIVCMIPASGRICCVFRPEGQENCKHL